MIQHLSPSRFKTDLAKRESLSLVELVAESGLDVSEELARSTGSGKSGLDVSSLAAAVTLPPPLRRFLAALGGMSPEMSHLKHSFVIFTNHSRSLGCVHSWSDQRRVGAASSRW